jgi:hypothetical protein
LRSQQSSCMSRPNEATREQTAAGMRRPWPSISFVHRYSFWGQILGIMMCASRKDRPTQT